MSDDLEPLTTDPANRIFIDVETRSSEDVTVVGAYRHNAAGRKPGDLQDGGPMHAAFLGVWR